MLQMEEGPAGAFYFILILKLAVIVIHQTPAVTATTNLIRLILTTVNFFYSDFRGWFLAANPPVRADVGEVNSASPRGRYFRQWVTVTDTDQAASPTAHQYKTSTFSGQRYWLILRRRWALDGFYSTAAYDSNRSSRRQPDTRGIFTFSTTAWMR